MISIFYCTSSVELDRGVFQFFLEKLPLNLRSPILKFKSPEDRQRALFAKLLLIEGLKDLGLHNYSLNQLQSSEYQRPYFKGNIDFNISHSGFYIICAISLDNRVGIDVEEIREIPVSDFDREFSKIEMEYINNSRNSMSEFYKLWTQKEAFLKAIGTGLYTPLNIISVIENTIHWNDKRWFLTEINLPETKDYISHLCTDSNRVEIEVKRIFF